MNKSTIDHYLPLNSLFKPVNKKTSSAYHKPTQYLNKTQVPLKSQYTPPNPIHFKVKQTHLCHSCHDKKNNLYGRQSLKLHELQGVQRDLSQKNVAEPVNQQRQAFSSSSRPPNYINPSNTSPIYISKTVVMNPSSYREIERSKPSPVTIDNKPISRFQLPIAQQEHHEEETIKNTDFLKKQNEELKNDRLKEEDLNIIINSQVPAKEEIQEQPIFLNTPSSQQETDPNNLHPTSHNFVMQRTQSNYFTDTIAKEQPPYQIKKTTQSKIDISIYRDIHNQENDFQETNAKIIRKRSNFQRIAPISSIASKSQMGVNTVRQETILNYVPSAIERESDSAYKQNINDREAFFNSTKRDTNRYIENIRAKLGQSYQRLEQAQKQIDSLVQKNLQLQCQRIKSNLYRAIEIELNDFKQSQRKKLSSNKFNYMSDLYQLKCNIDLRLQELQEYQATFKSDYKWKTIVGDLLTPDYEATILFLINKSEQIQEDSLLYTQQFIAQYNNKMFIEVLQPLKKEMRLAIENLFLNFNRLREKKMSYQTFMQKYYEDEQKTRS